MLTKKWATIYAVLATLVVAAVVEGTIVGDGAPKRELPQKAKAVEVDIRERKLVATNELPKFVYCACKKGREGTWDLGKGGVEHVRFGTSFWVVSLVPNGESPNYYWAKEKLSSGVIYWAFKKTPATDGSFEILYSTDDTGYGYWDEKGIRGDRVAP